MDRKLERELSFEVGFDREADRLEGLQAALNDGRGVNCVRSIVLFLRRGDWEKATAVANHEWDKIRACPEIVAACQEVGLGGS